MPEVRTRLILFLALGLGLWGSEVQANNLRVTNVTLIEGTGDYATVVFDISWDNSWRDGVNWDAAWVFVKYQPTGGSWSHATLSATDNDHSVPAGATIRVGTTGGVGKGVFLYRSSTGSGPVAFNQVQLRWLYGTDGLAPEQTVQVSVFAIEMVYIPEGSFYLGDGSSYGTFRQVGSNSPIQISTSGVVVKVEDTSFDDGQLEGAGIYVDGDGGINSNDSSASINNPDFPTGYRAFYMMKYEISQGQYADFLNALPSNQASTRSPNFAGSYRHTISFDGSIYTASRPDRACNYLSWMDGSAYADWAGLRPMTELEFEKACRGDQPAVAGEYAWGNTSITEATTISGTEDGTETVNGNCNYNYVSFSGGDGGSGPLRVGIFATGTSTREQAGASYYGVMELSGNLWERCVTLGNSTGRGFMGSHGDGVLSSEGHATGSDWPGYSSGAVTGATGAGFRGGPWSYLATSIRVSYRYRAAYASPYRGSVVGFRCVRSAP